MTNFRKGRYPEIIDRPSSRQESIELQNTFRRQERTKAAQHLVVGLVLGVILIIGLVAAFGLPPSTARQIILDSHDCWESGQRAVYIHGEVGCRE